MSLCSSDDKITINDYECPIVTSEMLSEKIAWMTVKCPELASSVVPGHCVMIFPSNSLDPLLGRPFGVCDLDRAKGEISVCYMLYGKGTDMMAKMPVGEKIRVRGPFGVPLPLRENKKIYLTAGGVGIAIFLLYNKLFPKVVAGLYLGIPGKGYERYSERILKIAPNAKIFTDDGSFGVGDSMFKVLPKNIGPDEEVWACGPTGFLKALKTHCSSSLDKLYFSLDKRMACGYGGCMGCVVETNSGSKRRCVDESLFRADEVASYGL
ncbi:MAG: hypothetical protein GXZ18_06590 [Synergistaceae bacterium]|nr:hypothetical protein [Synergistaceae bacterium]